MNEIKTSYSFSQCLRDISEDLEYYGGNNLLSKISVFLFNISFKLIFWYRISRYLYLKHNTRSSIYLLIKYREIKLGGNLISDKAQIGKRLKLAHPIGVVIGKDVVIEDDVTIFQQVTLGSHGRKNEPKQFPIIQQGAVIYAGAKVVGGVRVGKNAIIGANSVVLQDIPDNKTAAGVPAKVRE